MIITKAIKLLIFYLVLRPLIVRNYRLRRESILQDEWYWADKIAVRYGYYVSDTAFQIMARKVLIDKDRKTIKKRG